MARYFINYGTGAGNKEVEVESLEEAKEIAVDGMQYTQQNVIIEHEGNTVAVARWVGVEPEEDEEILERFGTFGYYAPWIDF